MSYLDELDSIAGISPKNMQSPPGSYMNELDAMAGIGPQGEGGFSPQMELLKFAKGSASGVGALPDLASQFIAAPLMNMAQSQPLSPEDEQLIAQQQALSTTSPEQMNQMNQNGADLERQLAAMQERLSNPGMSEALGRGVESAVGRKIPSEGFSYNAGQLFAPMPGSGYINAGKALVTQGAKVGAKLLKKVAAKELKQAAGASAALNFTPSLTEEGGTGRMAEDFLKSAIGGRLGAKASLNALKSAPGKLLNKIKNAPLAVASIGSNPNKEVFDLAKKHKINLPANVGMDSSPLNFTMNNAFKSLFTSRQYKDAMKKSKESLGKAIRKNVDVLGKPNTMRAAASDEFSNFIRKDENKFQNISSDKYTKMIKDVTPDITVVPSHTKEFIAGMKSKLKNPTKGPNTKAVTTEVEKIAKNWGLIEPDTDLIKELERNPHYAEQLLKEMETYHKKVPVSELMETKQELQDIVRKDPHLQGKKKGFLKLIGSITKDIEANTNPEFQKSLKEYNEWFKGNIGQRFRNTTAKSLLRDEMPKEAYKLTATPQGISTLKKIAGASPEGIEKFKVLKKARVRHILKNALKDERAGPGAFYRVFHSEENQQLLKKLVGKKSYGNLQEISKVAKDFSEAGQDLLNTSGTSHVSKDYERVKGALKEAFGVLGIIAAPHGGYVAGAGIAGVNLGSRLMSNEKFVNSLREYAMAKKAGKVKVANNLKTRLLRIGTVEAKAARLALSRKGSDEEDE